MEAIVEILEEFLCWVSSNQTINLGLRSVSSCCLNYDPDIKNTSTKASKKEKESKYSRSIQRRLMPREKERKLQATPRGPVQYPSYQQNLAKTWTGRSGKQQLEMIQLVGLTY